MNTIQLEQFGQSLGTRDLARDIRVKITDKFDKEENKDRITISFNNVEVVNNSFADELLGVLVSEWGFDVFKRRVVLKDVNDFVKATINSVLLRRLGPRM